MEAFPGSAVRSIARFGVIDLRASQSPQRASDRHTDALWGTPWTLLRPDCPGGADFVHTGAATTLGP